MITTFCETQYNVKSYYHFNLETNLETSQTSKMELFTKKVNGWKPLTVFVNNSILDVSLGFESTSLIIY